jgi:putative redox protein
MHVPFSSLVVKVDGTLSEDHPRIYTHLKVTYEVGTEETYRPQIEKAVELSVTKYCSVSAMLAKASEITHEIVIIQP